MKSYTIQKVDTNLYIKGLSGTLVFRAAWGIIADLLLFVLLYILGGALIAVLVCVPAFFAWLYSLNRIQKKYGPAGWQKKKTAHKLPLFVLVKQRICKSTSHENIVH
jgi:hypothetical protein